jgi:hypothetical protein
VAIEEKEDGIKLNRGISPTVMPNTSIKDADSLRVSLKFEIERHSTANTETNRPGQEYESSSYEIVFVKFYFSLAL